MGAVAGVVIVIFIVRMLSGSIKVSRGALAFGVKLAIFVFAGTMVQVTTTDAEVASAVLHIVAFVLIWAPIPLLRWLIVPLRMPRTAYWATRICWPLGLTKEIEASAVVYGALALARTSPSEGAISWLERKLRNSEPINGAGVVAAGLLAALRKDIDRARGLLATADRMHTRLIPRSMRVIARDWLVMDAARVGNWHRVVRLGRHGMVRLRWSYSMARIGERLTGNPKAWRNWQLWPCFLWAPRRRVTYPLFRRALRVPVRRSVRPDAAPSATGLPLTLGGLARALESANAYDAELLAQSIDAVARDLESVHELIEQRLSTLGGRGDAGSVLAQFRQRLVDLVTPLIEDDPYLARAAQPGSIMEQAVWQVRRRLLGDIDARCKDYRERTAGASSLDQIAEWETWARLNSSANRLLELDSAAENILFEMVFAPVCNFAVYQHNGRKRIALAHDMFIWLLRYAQDAPDARQLLAKNIQAGIAGI
jgi:hypothetical protein